jgi:hypothetical protein
VVSGHDKISRMPRIRQNGIRRDVS